jgi:hypothetical protein
VELFNSSILGKREEGAVPISEEEGAREAILGSRTVVCGSGRQPKSGDVWIDLR